MKMFKKAALTAIAAAGIVASTAVPAQATTGGWLYNQPYSDRYVSVTTTRPAGNWYTVNIGANSGSLNVQGFTFKYGCKGKSQYSGGAWPYVGGNIYYYSTNNLRLAIEVWCP